MEEGQHGLHGESRLTNLKSPERWTVISKTKLTRCKQVQEVQCTNAEDGGLAARPDVLVN